MREFKIQDVLAWIAFAIVILYFILKVLGVIHSPPIADLIAIASGAYFVGRYAKIIDDLSQDTKRIKRDMRELDKKCPIFKAERK